VLCARAQCWCGALLTQRASRAIGSASAICPLSICPLSSRSILSAQQKRWVARCTHAWLHPLGICRCHMYLYAHAPEAGGGHSAAHGESTYVHMHMERALQKRPLRHAYSAHLVTPSACMSTYECPHMHVHICTRVHAQTCTCKTISPHAKDRSLPTDRTYLLATRSLADSLAFSLACWLARLLACSLACWLARLLAYSLACLLTRLLTHSLITLRGSLSTHGCPPIYIRTASHVHKDCLPCTSGLPLMCIRRPRHAAPHLPVASTHLGADTLPPPPPSSGSLGRHMHP